MSLSKMPIAEKKEFVIKHTFTDVANMEPDNGYFGPTENHFNVYWRIGRYHLTPSTPIIPHEMLAFCLECLKFRRGNDIWSIEFETDINILSDTGKILKSTNSEKHCYTDNRPRTSLTYFPKADPESSSFFAGNMTVEMHVKITEMTGIRTEKLRSFDESTEEFSDVVLKVEDEKFYVLKKYLAAHSSWFKSLFNRHFDEPRPEITLTGGNRWDFQNFLEILYSEQAIDDDTICGILDLAVFFDSKTAIKRCEEFLMEKTKLPLEKKLEVATKYNMDRLKTNLSEMSTGKEMKFVMKKVFTDITTMRTFKMQYEEEETHFNIPWRISRCKYDNGLLSIGLTCLKHHNVENCLIEYEAESKLISITGENLCKTDKNRSSDSFHHFGFSSAEVEKYLIDGKLTVELHVNITSMCGIRPGKLRSFDESTKEFSDVVLTVEDKQFYVLKKYLAAHSSYFQSLFFGNFDESKQSEITLKDVDRCDFQNFLEILYSEPAIDDNTVDGILHLADMYDSKTAIRKCEEFLIEKSKHSLKEKFQTSVI